MIEETGTVIAARGDLAEVECQRRSTCGACAANGACGTSLLERHFGRRQILLTVHNPMGARPGDQVVVGVPEDALRTASVAAYLVPLLAMLAGALAGAGAGESWPQSAALLEVLGGAAGLAAGLGWLARFSRARGRDPRYRAVILRRSLGVAAVTLDLPTPPAQGRGSG
jgi:sigma-E factor negative regulatory protein RseC